MSSRDLPRKNFNRLRVRGGKAGALVEVISRDATRQLSYTPDQSGAFGGRDHSSRIEQVEKMRALQAQVIGGQDRKPPLGFCVQPLVGTEQPLGFLLRQFQELPGGIWSGAPEPA